MRGEKDTFGAVARLFDMNRPPLGWMGLSAAAFALIALIVVTTVSSTHISRLNHLIMLTIQLEVALDENYLAMLAVVPASDAPSKQRQTVLSRTHQLRAALRAVIHQDWYQQEPHGKALIDKIHLAMQEGEALANADPALITSHKARIRALVSLLHAMKQRLSQDLDTHLAAFWRWLLIWEGLGVVLVLLAGFQFYRHERVQSRLVNQLAIANREKAREIELKSLLQRKQAYFNTLLGAIRRVNQLITQCTSRRELIQGATEILVRQMRYSSAWVVLFDGQGNSAEYMGQGFPERQNQWRRFLADGNIPPCVDRTVNEEIAVYRQALPVCSLCPLGFMYEGNSILITKMVDEQRVIGAIGVTITPENLGIDESENLALFAELASDIRFALHKIAMQERQAVSEREIHRREAQLRSLAANVPGVVYQLRQRYENGVSRLDFSYLSPRLRGIFGLDPEVVARDPKLMLSQVHPEDRVHHFLHPRETHELQPWQQEWRILNADGKVRWIRGTARPRPQSDGSVLWDGLLLDITDRKQAELSLQQEKIRFRELFTNMSNGVAIYKAMQDGEDFLIVDFNEAGLKITGQRWSNIIGRRVGEVFPGIRGQGLFEALQETWRTGEARALPTRQYMDDQTEIWVDNYLYKLPSGELVAVLEDVSQRKRAEMQLRESEAHFRALFDAAPVSLWEEDFSAIRALLDQHPPQADEEAWDRYLGQHPELLTACVRAARVLRVNRQTLTLFGTEDEQRLFAGLDRIFTPESIPVFRAELASLAAGNPRFEREAPQCALDGRELWTLIRVTLAPGHETRWSKVFVSITDITGRKAMESALVEARARLEEKVEARTEALQRANRKLQRLSQMKDEFLASMSHELRSPLNAVLTGSEVMLEGTLGPLTERQQKALRRICDSGSHLLSLINDILDVAKAEAGKMELQIEPVSPHDLAHGCLMMIRESALKKQLRVRTELSSEITQIEVDQRRIKQVLINLLSNAVKFTPQGGEIGLSFRGVPSQGEVIFTVWDTGIGIDPALRDHLFQAFVQLDSRLSRKYEGTGLGLALVKDLTELHGGRIEVDSQPEAGSRFDLILPWRPTAPDSPQPAPLAEASPQEAPKPTKGKSILLADDNATGRDLLADYLHHLGYQVQCVENGEATLARLESSPPDALLLDVQMPGIDGLEVIRRIRARTEWRDLPVIALTALAMPGDRERCLEAGMDAYLGKPVQIHDVVRVLESFFQPTMDHADPAHS